MGQYLIDTNAVVDYLLDLLPEGGKAFMDKVINSGSKLSIMTKIELLCWNTDIEQTVRNFIADSEVFDISDAVINHCVALRRTKRIKTPDAIIAATALANGYALITANEKDFRGVEGLLVVNPNKYDE
jgi:predicted nucleic acid-binding protein